MSEQQLSMIAVGQPFQVFGGAYANEQFDGAVFDTLGESSGYVLAIYMRNMSFGERLLLEKRGIEVRGIFEGNFAMLFFRFKGTDLIFEANFSPTRRDQADAMQMLLENHMVTVVGVESANNIVKTLRVANMPKAMKRKCITAWGKAFDVGEDHHERFIRWVSDMDARYTIPQLWQRADKLGPLGE